MMLDIATLDSSIEAELKLMGSILLKSRRGLHFIANKIIGSQKKRESKMKQIKLNKIFSPLIYKNFIDMSLKRGYATLRLTENTIKPATPFFFIDR